MQIIQIGMNTSDIAGSLRLYAEAFGFRNAGAQALWGSSIKIQGLETSARALLWWMVGSQPFFQLEIYHHTNPPQRPLPSAWRPCDHGWVRFGIKVADIASTLEALAANGVVLLGQADDARGKRAAFRDPYLGVVVEVIEEPGVPGPMIAYVASSVADIDKALAYYRDVLGFPILPLDRLHTPSDEALWGLEGAVRSGFVVDAGAIPIEVVEYTSPLGKPRPADYRGSDQGIVNIALGSRRKADVADAFARLAKAGFVPPAKIETDDLLAGYITEPGHELELVSVPESLDAAFGFNQAVDFFR